MDILEGIEINLLLVITIAGVSALVLWLLVFGILYSLRKKRTKAEKPKEKPKPAKPEEHHSPSEHQKPHGNGHHGAAHDDHKEKAPIWKLIILWSLAIASALLVIRFVVIPFFTHHDIGKIPGERRSLRFEYTQTHGSTNLRFSSSSPAPSVTPYVRKPFTAPPHASEWPAWIDVPSGYSLLSCEANDDLSCSDTESDPTKVTYDYQCKGPDGTEFDRASNPCTSYIAIRMRSKDETARKLAYWFEPYSG